MSDKIILEGLEIECVIGIFDWERETRQMVSIDFELECDSAEAAKSDNIKDAVDYKSITKQIISLVEPSEFYLIETMAENIADVCLGVEGVNKATVRVSKPGAVRGSKNVSVKITRPRTDHVIYLGVGGNIEPDKNIPEGLLLLRSRFDVTKISPTYRSKAFGVEDEQPDYHNLAVGAGTDKDLFAVRAELRWIEEIMGRKRTIDRFAPRTLDIDLLLYDDLLIRDEGSQLPHEQLLTQQFVYMPMMEIAPDLIVPGRGKALKDCRPEYEDEGLKIERFVKDR